MISSSIARMIYFYVQFELNEIGHTQGSTKCELHFKLRTPVACPWFAATMGSRGSKGLGFYILLALALFIAYNIAGVYYNQKVHKIYGYEAIPHVEKWRQLPSLMQGISIKALNQGLIAMALARGYVESKVRGYKGV